MATDSTQHLIDLAAKFTDGKATVATVAELGDRMLEAGASSEELTALTKKMGLAFEESESAIKASSEALAIGEANYGELETAADRAAKSVEKLGVQIDAQRVKLQAASDAGDARGADRAAAKLRELVDRQGEAVSKSAAAAAALKVEAAALDTVRGKADQASQAHAAIGKGMKNVEAAATKAAEAERKAAGTQKANEIAEGLAKLGGPLGVAGQKAFGMAAAFDKLGKAMGTAGPYVAIAVAIVAIASAAAVATFAIAKWGVAMADANRTQTLLAAGVTGSEAGGAELEKTIARLGDVVPQTRDELRAMAADLAKSGLRGKDLSASLEHAAVAAAELKFGPAFAKQLLALSVQSKRLDENLSDTFGGLQIEALLGGFQTLVALFDATTESGQTLKFLFEALFQPIIDGAASTATSVERLFIIAENLALEAFIALKPYRTEIEAVGKAFLFGAAVIVASFAAALAIVAGAIAAVVIGIGLLVVSINQLIDLVPEAIELLGRQLTRELEHMADLGTEIVNGLINGIKDGAARLAASLVDTVKGGVAAVEKFLHIGSPSKLMFDMGVDTTAGFSGGVESGTDDTQSAMLDAVTPPRVASSGAGAVSGAVVNISITVEGRGQSDDGIASTIAERLRDLFESGALMLGGGEVPSGG